jgi:MarR family transcriptional regulator for hemolysin
MNTTDPRERLLDDLSRVQRKMRALFDARVKERGLTLPRARALLILGRGAELNQRELAEELDIETPTLVRLLDGMEKQGFIERRSVEGDRRAKQIAMTPRGAKVA